MAIRPRRPRSSARRLALFACLLASLGSSARADRFRSDDPVRRDHDDLPIPKPGVIELSTTYDIIEHTFHHRPGRTIPKAVNVNTLGEVPDSSWFTNRPPLSIDELVRGPDTTAGPDTSQAWTVIAAKSGGITPGFTIRDARGDVYFIKFDPIRYPRLSSAADVITTKFFHAFGYNVPENHVAYFRRDWLQIAPEARVTLKGGRKRMMRPDDLDRILANVLRLPDGTIRCVASRRLAGEPLGPRKFHGTRGDDANDVFPHEHRRDLRGLRVFSAWLNHDDSRSVNSLDMYVGDEGRRHVKHYLIDFSSSLGSGSDARRQIAPQNPRAGNEYIIEKGPILKAAFSLGLWERPWRKVEYKVYPEVGRIEAEFFRPDRWKPEYPNPAFERMLPEDAFWAARVVARFGDEAVRALVHTGDFTDPEAERHLANTLIARRDKVLGHYLRQLNPLDGFRLAREGAASVLTFSHLGEQAKLGDPGGYEYQWFRFDNAADKAEPLADPARAGTASLPLPVTAGEYLMVRIRCLNEKEPGWREPVDVYLRGRGEPEIVGIERENRGGAGPAR
jgi:hypothetical protein